MENLKPGGIDYRAIAEIYGYNPVPEGFSAQEPVLMNIDWNQKEEQRLAKQYHAMNIHALRLRDFPIFYLGSEKYRIVDRSSILTDCGDISMKIEVGRSYSMGRKAFIELCLANNHINPICSYIATLEEDNLWNFEHRLTLDQYRELGIGSKMIKYMENCIKAYSDATGQDQKIILSASQLPVLNTFLKAGYSLADADKQRFSEVVNALESGDQKYLLASCHEDFKQSYRSPRAWYIFEKEIFDHYGQDRMWSYDLEHQCLNYLKYSVRFNLEKTITASSKTIDDHLSKVIQQTKDCLQTPQEI